MQRPFLQNQTQPNQPYLISLAILEEKGRHPYMMMTVDTLSHRMEIRGIIFPVGTLEKEQEQRMKMMVVEGMW